MFTQKTFLTNPAYVAIAMLWLGIGLVACNATSDLPPTTTNEQTATIELPAQDSQESDEDSNSVVDEERVEEEIISVEEEENPPTEAETGPEPAMTIANSEEGVNFQTIAHGDSFIAELMDPTILVAGSSEEASVFDNLFDDTEVSKQIDNVDFAAKWLVLVFSGTASSSGYGISIEVVQPINGEVQLRVQQSEPDPDLMVSAVITYPYHLIAINKSDLPGDSAISWKMYDREDSLLAEVTYP